MSCFNSPTARLKEKFAVVEAWLKHLRAAGWKEDAAPLTVMAGMLSLFRVDQHLSVNFNASGFTLAEVEVSSNGVGLEQISAKKRLAVRCMPSILDLGWGKNLAPEFRHSAHPSVRRRVSSTR